jgi:hypothetical protein
LSVQRGATKQIAGCACSATISDIFYAEIVGGKALAAI